MKSFKFVVIRKNGEEDVFYKNLENTDVARNYIDSLKEENISIIQVLEVIGVDEKYGELLNCICQYSSNTLR